jgi:hypothetical protein
MNSAPLMYSITFKQKIEPFMTHDDLKRVTNMIIENWSKIVDETLANATPEDYKNPWNYVDLNRGLISGKLLKYNSRVVGDDLVIEFNLNEILDSSSEIKADYWEDKYLQNYNDVEKLFHPLIDRFFNNFGGAFSFIMFEEMVASNNFKEFPQMQHKLFNK